MRKNKQRINKKLWILIIVSCLFLLTIGCTVSNCSNHKEQNENTEDHGFNTDDYILFWHPTLHTFLYIPKSKN